MTAIITSKEEVAPANTSKEGIDYDRCPHDGCIEVEPTYKHGGITARGKQEYRNWSMYSADRRKGGCGMPWTRTTEQGRQRDHANNLDTRWLATSAAKGRHYSMPSDEYRDNYAKVFGHD